MMSRFALVGMILGFEGNGVGGNLLVMLMAAPVHVGCCAHVTALQMATGQVLQGEANERDNGCQMTHEDPHELDTLQMICGFLNSNKRTFPLVAVWGVREAFADISS